MSGFQIVGIILMAPMALTLLHWFIRGVQFAALGLLEAVKDESSDLGPWFVLFILLGVVGFAVFKVGAHI